MKIPQKSTSTTFLFLIIAFNSPLSAQSNFEGKIIFTISYADMPAEMTAMLPKDMTIYIKGNKSKVEQNQMMGKQVVVSDLGQQNGFMEMNISGQKIRINISTAEFKQEAEQMTNIEYLNETKTIVGYPCKKAIMKDETGQMTMTVFYTEKINNKAQTKFVGLKGFPLQYTMTQQNMTLEMTASEISKESVSDAIFNKSEGYKEMSQADLQKMMGGGSY